MLRPNAGGAFLMLKNKEYKGDQLMQWTGLNELREKYLSFFESKGHTRLNSFPLVPQGDNSLLLINSGMAPLKKFFLGTETPPNVRVTTCQKCIRTPDIERVGHTARHGTYFEMLGNFSFGDYFKKEAIAWGWEFLTKTLEIPADKLWITIYEDDDEAEQLWENMIGIPHERIIRLGKADNFWEHGSGPCGPCSEIHFDRGEKYGPFENFEQASDCDRVIEIWNLVFSQFDSDGNGNYAEMKNKNIDTGMGLERLACAMQDVGNLFEVDTVQKIMKKVMSFAGVEYKKDEKTDVSLRVITDHIRSTTFMVGDGVLPSNVGRGYVLRRLLRRAARHGRLLGINEPFLFKVCDTVIDENMGAYPELDEKREYIKKVIRIEEENFAKTIDKGIDLLNAMLAEIVSKDCNNILSGDDAFKLNDTFGFPLDLTIEIASEKGIEVDKERFDELLQLQKDTARQDRSSKVGSSWSDDSMGNLDIAPTVFDGYKILEEDAKITGIFIDGIPVNEASEGNDAIIILDRTPFYAESGGQVGDKGIIIIGESKFIVSDTKKTSGGQFIHIGAVDAGSFSLNDNILAKVDKTNRKAIMRNHTAAHLLQASLREVLGDHVHQAGQLVNSSRCRFDFNHFSAMTTEEIAKVEALVNEKILSALDVITNEMPINEAKKLGAMALFGEKYGDVVRVVNVNSASIEFCGGTHADNTSKLGLFKIISESSVAAGVRRIEAVTGTGVLELINSNAETINEAAAVLKLANTHELVSKCQAVMNEVKELEKQITELNDEMANAKVDSLFDNAIEVNGVKVISALFNPVKTDVLRKMGDRVREKAPRMIAVFAGVNGDSGNFVVSCGKEAVAMGAHAGKIAQRVSAITHGKGGGRPDSAMAGIGDKFKIDEALSILPEIIDEFIEVK